MIKVAIVGFGFMGRMHFKCFQAIEGVRVVTVCDTNPQAFDLVNNSRGNIENNTAIDIDGVKTYTDYEEMLAAEALDCVSITLPTHLHCEFALKAMDAGLHVFCEKPIALNEHEGVAMIETAKKSGRKLQIGHCIRFWPEYVKAAEIIKSGIFGKVKVANFERFSAVPQWSAGGWLKNRQMSGGMLLDLHIHDSDYICSIFGMPRSVVTRTIEGVHGDDDHVFTMYMYNDETLVMAHASWSMPQSFGFKMGFMLTLEQATLVYNCTRQPSLMVFPFDDAGYSPAINAGNGYSLEISHFVNVIKNEQLSKIFAATDALNSLRLVLAERQSAQSKQEVFLNSMSSVVKQTRVVSKK